MKLIPKLALLLAIVLFTASCSAAQKSEYSTLCDIYAANVNLNIPTNKKEVKINIAVQKELPEFYNSHFKLVMLAKPSQRYKLFKNMAKKSSGIDWKCDPAKKFYENNFK